MYLSAIRSPFSFDGVGQEPSFAGEYRTLCLKFLLRSLVLGDLLVCERVNSGLMEISTSLWRRFVLPVIPQNCSTSRPLQISCYFYGDEWYTQWINAHALIASPSSRNMVASPSTPKLFQAEFVLLLSSFLCQTRQLTLPPPFLPAIRNPSRSSIMD